MDKIKTGNETNNNYTISVLPGDGIGPEVMTEALKVLGKVERKYGFRCEIKEGLVGGAAYDVYETPLPAEIVEMAQGTDAVLLGSIGGPKWDGLPPHLRPELGGLLALRKALRLYANIRPVRLFDALKENSPLTASRLEGGVDLLTVRELAGGIYFGEPKRLDDSEGLDTMRYRKTEVQRIAEVAFDIAGNRRKKVTSVDKANVLYSSMMWRQTVAAFAQGYPDIELEHMYVDNAAMQMILNPGQFDVILTTNLFGDILSDESAALGGSLGILPSASFGETVHLYEPAGGSAPDIAGKGTANPIAQILSAALMLDYSFGMPEASRDIFDAVDRVLSNGFRTRDLSSGIGKVLTTSEMGSAICDSL